MESADAALGAKLTRSLGLDYGPFAEKHWDAAADPNLHRYLAPDENVAAALSGTPMLVFAPAGGGKTAFRIAVARSCWLGSGKPHLFPVPYVLGDHFRIDELPDKGTAHKRRLTQAMANALLLVLAHRPSFFLELHPDQQRRIVGLLDASLSFPLNLCLSTLGETNGLSDLVDLLERSYRISALSGPDTLGEFCAQVAALQPHTRRAFRDDESHLRAMVSAVRDDLGFRTVLVLVDAVDAFTDASDPSSGMVGSARQIMDQADQWINWGVHLQLFLPEELRSVLCPSGSHRVDQFQVGRLSWGIDRLAEMIRRRVYVASKGGFGSLDWVASPDLRDLETRIAREVPPLPREALALTAYVLQACARRASGRADMIVADDFVTALDQYRISPAALNARQSHPSEVIAS